MKYHLVVLGCQMNRSDAERVEAVLEEIGLAKTEDENDADILGVVACSVRQKAIDRVYSQIHKWNEFKKSKPLLTFVCGCILPKDEIKFLKLFDIAFRMDELKGLPELISQYGAVTGLNTPWSSSKPLETDSENLNSFWNIAPKYSSAFEAFVPIQNGCDKFCTFCAVPYTRGRENSRPSHEILAEVENLLEKGYRSITLLGQNVNSYGLDKKGDEINFANLLVQIGELGNKHNANCWVSFTSPHPRDMTSDVIDAIAKYPILAKQIHLPLQSGDDDILVRMNRNHNMEQYAGIVKVIWDKIPDVTLSTDLIVGFTGESEEQFLRSVDAVKHYGYSMTFISMYSPRPGAASYRWDDDVPLQEKKRRHMVLTSAAAESSLFQNRKKIGMTQKILLERFCDRTQSFYGRTEGKVLVKVLNANEMDIGRFIDVKINSAVPFALEGEKQ